jgi:hypothetical protein
MKSTRIVFTEDYPDLPDFPLPEIVAVVDQAARLPDLVRVGDDERLDLIALNGDPSALSGEPDRHRSQPFDRISALENTVHSLAQSLERTIHEISDLRQALAGARLGAEVTVQINSDQRHRISSRFGLIGSTLIILMTGLSTYAASSLLLPARARSACTIRYAILAGPVTNEARRQLAVPTGLAWEALTVRTIGDRTVLISNPCGSTHAE